MRIARRAAQFAALATCLIAAPLHPLHAALVLPGDFDPLRNYTFHRCEFYFFLATICVDGQAYYGFNTTLGQYGVSYDFSTALSNPIPTDGSFLEGRMVGFAFIGIPDPSIPNNTIPTLVSIGSIFNFAGPAITSGLFFSPLLTADSPLPPGGSLASFRGNWASNPAGCCVDERFGATTVTLTPEPATITLLASGLAALAVARRRRRGLSNS